MTKRLTKLVAVVLVVVAMTAAIWDRAAAQDTTVLRNGTAGAAGFNLQSLNNIDIPLTLVKLLQDNIPEGKPRLMGMYELPLAPNSLIPKICSGFPAIVHYSKTVPSNGACFSRTMPANNLSCSCLEGYNETDAVWEFRLRRPEPVGTSIPKSLPPGAELGVSSIILFSMPKAVKTLKIVGAEATPATVDFKQVPFPGYISDISIIHTQGATPVDNIHVENVDMGDLVARRGFIPSDVKNLTIRGCRAKSLPTDLLGDFNNLVYLDVSSNLLEGVYPDINEKRCQISPCSLKTLNVTNNKIKQFPSNLLNINSLETLSLRKNPITNMTVTTSNLELLKHLKTLELDAPSVCSMGDLQSVLDTQLCVISTKSEDSSGSSPSGTITASESNGTNSYLMYGVIGGCLIIAVVVFALVKRKSCRHDDDDDNSKEPFDGYFDNTLSYDDTHATVSATLLNDPIIITNRIPFKDIRVANCISKGGFGLVYSGVYNRRRVAIKKIRPDRAGDIKQIECFLKEICLIATLNHPRIVEFVGVSWDSLRNLCAVTEFMERGDLREVLHGFKLRNCRLTWPSHKTVIAMHIAEALTYLHSLQPKVIHRDLKSKNVLLDANLHAKLSDFGISRERNFEETHMTAGIGTSFWIAPEVLLGRDYDERADIFSFGVVLSEIDTDDYPYWNAENPNVGNKAQENMILQMVASGVMRPTFSDDCPKPILELADQCLQADPENRPSAAEIAFKLQQVLQFADPQTMTHSSSSSAVE